MSKKEVKPPVDEGLPAWMATFADMVTLLLCFFVLMLSFAKQDLQKFRDVLGSIQNAFGVAEVREKSEEFALDTTSDDPEMEAQPKEDLKILQGAIMRVRSLMDKDPELRETTGISEDNNGILMRVDSSAMFDPGSANLKPEARKVLDKVVTIMKEYNYNLVVRGHTDDREKTGTSYPSLWELSAARAAVALAYITEHGGIPSKRLKAVGYAYTRPLLPNDAEEKRQKNRRVEFYFHLPQQDSW